MSELIKRYPALTLDKAVDLAARLDKIAPRGASITLDALAEHLKVSSKSSGFQRNVATLGYYGLTKDQGSKEAREISLSDEGKRIVLLSKYEDEDFWAAIAKAVLQPSLFRHIYDRWGDVCPTDEEISKYLRINGGFTDQAAAQAAECYLTSVTYAGIYEAPSPGVSLEAEGRQPATETGPTAPIGAVSSREAHPSPLPQDPSSVTLPIPLPSLKTASITIPRPLSDLDYQTLKLIVNGYLDSLRQGIVEGANENGAPTRPASSTSSDQTQNSGSVPPSGQLRNE